MLRLDNVLEFDERLVRRIDDGLLLEHGSPEEVEIRACALHAVQPLDDVFRIVTESYQRAAHDGAGPTPARVAVNEHALAQRERVDHGNDRGLDLELFDLGVPGARQVLGRGAEPGGRP